MRYAIVNVSMADSRLKPMTFVMECAETDADKGSHGREMFTTIGSGVRCDCGETSRQCQVGGPPEPLKSTLNEEIADGAHRVPCGGRSVDEGDLTGGDESTDVAVPIGQPPPRPRDAEIIR